MLQFSAAWGMLIAGWPRFRVSLEGFTVRKNEAIV
jgi:hypothetical protein